VSKALNSLIRAFISLHAAVLIREALRGVLQELKGDAAVLEAPDSRQAMQRIAENPDLELILLDLRLPDRSGFDVLAELRERHPAISVVVLSGRDARDDIAKALDLGALGFIPKSAQREVMLSAFKLALPEYDERYATGQTSILSGWDALHRRRHWAACGADGL
jgi:DNA-binding NarL/FixJ family response regulator